MKRYVLKSLYGLSAADYAALLLSQGGVCAICGLPPANQTKNDSRLHVDHDHSSDAVRGLLCRECNLGVGFFEDDPGLMERAIAYLRRTASLKQTQAS
jgi:hypothetical protein